MDVVEYLLEQRRRSYEILKKNSDKQEIVASECPQCQQLKQEIEYEQQFINPTVPENVQVPEPIIPENTIHTYTEDESESESEEESLVEFESESEVEESESESEEDIEQQTENQSLPLFL